MGSTHPCWGSCTSWILTFPVVCRCLLSHLVHCSQLWVRNIWICSLPMVDEEQRMKIEQCAKSATTSRKDEAKTIHDELSSKWFIDFATDFQVCEEREARCPVQLMGVRRSNCYNRYCLMQGSNAHMVLLISTRPNACIAVFLLSPFGYLFQRDYSPCQTQ